MRRIAIHHRTWSSGLGICLVLAVVLVLASCGSDGNKGVTTSTANTSATLGTTNGNHQVPTPDEVVEVIVAKVEAGVQHITGKLDDEDLAEIQRLVEAKVQKTVDTIPGAEDVQNIINQVICGKQPSSGAAMVPSLPPLGICPPNGGAPTT